MMLIKLGLPAEENIVAKNKFIANKIFPVAVRSTQIKDQFIMLFVAYQDYDESYVYFQMLLKAENQFDLTCLENHELNIAQLANQKDNPTKQKQIEAYKDLIAKMNGTNVFATDFAMEEDTEHGFYYKATAVRAIDKTHASIISAYFPLDNFIKLRLYLDRIINYPMNPYNNFEAIFQDSRFFQIEQVNIETVKLDCTKVISEKVGLSSYSSHYTMHCGPSKFIMNYNTISMAGVLKIPLDASLYDTFYHRDCEIHEVFTDKDYLFILYEERSLIDGSFKKMKALRLTKELAEKTNFIDPEFIFIKSEKEQ